MLLVVAWDGASMNVVEPLLRNGELPNLAALLERGAWRDVGSTVPAVTFPAWTTFSTAATPDRHGLTDFTVRDGYRVRFVNSTYRRLPTIFSAMSAAGLRVGTYALPATFPPEPINGIQVCGFDTPLGAGGSERATHPASLGPQLKQRYGGLAVEGPSQSRIGRGWHERALEHLRDSIELRTRIVSDLLHEQHFDCFMVHYAESDTVSHHFWQFCDRDSPRHRPSHFGDAIADVYRSLDASLAKLLRAAGDEARVMLISDHGSRGSSDRVVHWNAWLAANGYLTFRRSSPFAGLAGALRRNALRLVPARLQPRLFAAVRPLAGRIEGAARFAGIDFSRTTAFSEETNYFHAIWLNVRGREPEGIVEPGEVPGLKAKLRSDLALLRDPFDGEPVVESVLDGGDLGDGPFASRMPDLVLRLRDPDGYVYAGASSKGGAQREPIRRLAAAEMTGERGTSMSGSHGPMGMSVLAGPGISQGLKPAADLAGAGATVLRMAGLSTSSAMNGKPWDDTVAAGDAERAPRPGAFDAGTDPVEYDADQEAEVAQRLRDLGYLE